MPPRGGAGDEPVAFRCPPRRPERRRLRPGFFRRRVGLVAVGLDDRHQLRQVGAGSIDPALDRADRAAADVGGFLVGEARGADQNERFALIRRQLIERLAEFAEFNLAMLLGLRFQRLGIATLAILDLAPALAIFRAEVVAQDRE